MFVVLEVLRCALYFGGLSHTLESAEPRWRLLSHPLPLVSPFHLSLEFWEQVLSHESADPLQMKRLHLRRVHCFGACLCADNPWTYLRSVCFRGGIKVLLRMSLQYLCWHNHPEWCAWSWALRWPCLAWLNPFFFWRLCFLLDRKIFVGLAPWMKAGHG